MKIKLRGIEITNIYFEVHQEFEFTFPTHELNPQIPFPIFFNISRFLMPLEKNLGKIRIVNKIPHFTIFYNQLTPN